MVSVTPARAASRAAQSHRRAVRGRAVIDDLDFENAKLGVEDISAAGELGTGGVLDVKVTMRNYANVISPTHPDRCYSSGYRYEVTVIPSWDESEQSVTECLTRTIVDSFAEHDFEIPLPEEEDTYNYDVQVRLPNDGEVVATTETISVVEGGDQRDETPSDGGDDTENGDDSGGGLPDWVPFAGGSVGAPEVVVLAALVGVLISN